MGYGSNSTSATIVLDPEVQTSDLNPALCITAHVVYKYLYFLYTCAGSQTGSELSGGIISGIVLVVVALIGSIIVAVLVVYFVKHHKTNKIDL